MSKYDVGIFGLWYGNNYGSQMTYFALKKTLEKLNYSTAVIWNPLEDVNKDYTTLPKAHPYQFAIRQDYVVTPRYRLNEMYKLNECCDRFILGSDQMWNYHLSRPYQQSYFFDFVDEDKIKLAYATSFGQDTYLGPDDEKIKTMHNLRRFSGISVRDGFSKNILENDFGIISEQVIDPVFLCPVECYHSLTQNIESVKESYIFAYILDPNKEMGKVLDYIAKKTKKVVYVAFDLEGDKKRQKEDLGAIENNVIVLDESPIVEHWLDFMKNADFVITDSFHGVCFSTIFHKQFIVKKNDKRGGKRFDYLLNMLQLTNRMVEEVKNIETKFEEYYKKNEIDYVATDNVVQREKEKSIEWLKEALEKKSNKTINNVLEKRMCVGCSSCANACPVDAVSMLPDIYGYYRSRVDNSVCINCGKCITACPALNLPEKNNEQNPTCYAFIAKEKEVLNTSSSGGVFPLLAREAFKKQGYVAGAAWKDDFSVEHILIDKEADLPKLQKSKYLQTYIGDSFRKVKEKLQNNEFVLFSGCPCQIAGLKKYLGKEYDNLVLVDLLCGNSPSKLFFKKYLDEAFPQGVTDYTFRHKVQGWNSDCVTLTLTDGSEIVRRGAGEDNYQRVYHNHTMCAFHCENCKYQSLPRFGDLTIGDFWGYSNHDNDVDTKNGISVVLINNEKGKKYFNLIPQESINVKKTVPLEWLGGNGYALKGRNYASSYRDRFYEAIQKVSFSQAVEYAFSSQGVSNYPNAIKCAPLQYNTAQMKFIADSNMWEEHFINGVTVLTTKQENPPLGYYASIPLMHTLVAGKKYRLGIQFKIKTDSKELNLHIKEALTKKIQIIHTHKVNAEDVYKWVKIETEFIPNSNVYSEFMIGAGHIKGKERFIAIDYIDIREK